MHPVIYFQSRLFDISLEPENPINPVYGSSLLDWLRTRISGDLSMTATEAEDWGWYSYVTWDGRMYLVGSCAIDSSDGNHEWILQIGKQRSIKERLFGKAKLTIEDPCFVYFKDIVANEPAFTDISVQVGP